MHSSAPAWTLAALAWLSACTSVPVGAIPDPLPETLEWTAAEPSDGGAFLGLEVRENDSGSLEELSFDPGVRVTRVVADSPAEHAGIRTGDVLLAWNGESVSDPTTLEQLLIEGDVEVPTRLEVQRGDAVFEVSVSLRPREGATAPARLVWRADPARSRAGWLAGQDGVVLVTSDPEGPFVAAGVAVGSVVTHLDGERQRSELALIRALLEREPGASVAVDFVPPGGGEARREEVELHGPGRRVTRAGVPILIGYRADANGEAASFYVLDVWLLSLFSYRREGAERHYSVLGLVNYSTGVGELETSL